jgi:hypothetical protein
MSEASEAPDRLPRRLSPEQRELWALMQPHVPQPSGQQSAQQSLNLAVDSFLFWCDFAGIGKHQPGAEAIRAEFEAAGVPDLCPPHDYLEEMRLHPERLWYLAPGAHRRR